MNIPWTSVSGDWGFAAWTHKWLYWQPTLNLSCRASMSSLTLCISWVWYSRMAPRMCGRTNNALNLEKILNISLAFLAVPSWSRSLAVIRVSTLSILSSYLRKQHMKWNEYQWLVKLKTLTIDSNKLILQPQTAILYNHNHSKLQNCEGQ